MFLHHEILDPFHDEAGALVHELGEHGDGLGAAAPVQIRGGSVGQGIPGASRTCSGLGGLTHPRQTLATLKVAEGREVAAQVLKQRERGIGPSSYVNAKEDSIPTM